MPNRVPVRVQDPAEVDPRVARTTRALGRALIGLIQERDFDDVTVQHIIDRAGVGRATFYAHYRNKQDALHSSYERLFEALEPMLARPSAAGPRLFPVAEFLAHIAEAHGVVDALQRAGRLEEFRVLLAGHAACLIDRRIASGTGVTPPLAGSLTARMLAGALMEAIQWWQDHPSAATPYEMDAAFHEFARAVMRGRL